MEITPSMRAWAEANKIRVDLAEATEEMLDHHRGKGSAMADWQAAWRTWMRNTKRFGGPGAGRVGGSTGPGIIATNAASEQGFDFGMPA